MALSENAEYPQKKTGIWGVPYFQTNPNIYGSVGVCNEIYGFVMVCAHFPSTNSGMGRKIGFLYKIFP
jgi:hypothetical protein